MSKLNHFAISSILNSEIIGRAGFGHGQIASLGDAQRHFDVLEASECEHPLAQGRGSEMTDAEDAPRGPLVWSTDPPKVAGWYWWLPPLLKIPQIIKLTSFDLTVEALQVGSNTRWAGPIQAPIEPPTPADAGEGGP
jgi:hypothetical protein